MRKRFKEANSGAWMFVSPSPRDLEKVRPIRNELERRRHHPLLFFRKRLEDDDARHSNPKKSACVPQEVELAKRSFHSAHVPAMRG